MSFCQTTNGGWNPYSSLENRAKTSILQVVVVIIVIIIATTTGTLFGFGVGNQPAIATTVHTNTRKCARTGPNTRIGTLDHQIAETKAKI
jgi:low affinity Fe/Cu permease